MDGERESLGRMVAELLGCLEKADALLVEVVGTMEETEMMPRWESDGRMDMVNDAVFLCLYRIRRLITQLERLGRKV